MELSLLKDIVLIFGLAVVVLLFCHRLRVAAVVGFLFTGVLAGPHGLGLIHTEKEVQLLAEIGVVLLLFTIGIEFSLKTLLRIKRQVFLGGSLQVIGTILLGFSLANRFGANLSQSLFIGFLVSLSSTAIVLRLLQQRGEVESPHGQTTLSILIFQDIVVVPMMLLLPVLAGQGGGSPESLLGLTLKGIGFLLLMFVSARWVVPQLLYLIARTRSRELFVLTVLVICFAVALLTHRLGLSLALGAFVAGLIISETEFSHETLGQMIPFRDVFTSLFFVSVGMMLDVTFLLQHPAMVILLALGVMLVKSILAGSVVLLLGLPLRTGILVGLSLCQVGEFSFVLFVKGTELGLLETRFYQFFLDVSVLTMCMTPFVVALAPKLGDLLAGLPLPRRLLRGAYGGPGVEGETEKMRLQDHVIIVGYGFNGRNIAHVAKMCAVPYVVIEMNPQTVKKERKRGEPIFFGDASQEAVLEQAGVKTAKVLVTVISDPVACRRITAAARKENPRLHLLVRTRYVSEMSELLDLGADEVIPEEFETSIEIFSRVLARYLIPDDEIQGMIAEARAGGYEMFRTLSKSPMTLTDLKGHLPDVDIRTFRVHEGAPIVGQSLSKIGMRKKYGITVLAIGRRHQVITNPDPDMPIEVDDLLVSVALRTRLMDHCSLFRNPESRDISECMPSERKETNSAP